MDVYGCSLLPCGPVAAQMYSLLYTHDTGEIVPFTEARANLTELLGAFEDKHEHVLVTRKGRRSAVMLSGDEHESLEETLDILQEKDLLESFAQE